MTNEEFNCWINGYLALATEEFITTKQLVIIKNHINLVLSVEGVLDFNIEHFLAFIEETIKTSAPIPFSDFKETWCKIAA